MWNFFVKKHGKTLNKIYKSIMLIYLICSISMACDLFLDSIPDQINVADGKKIKIKGTIPIQIKDKINEYDEKERENAAFAAYRPDENGGKKAEGERKDTAGRENEKDRICTCCLFGIWPVKEVNVHVVEDQKVYASGRLVGIYEQTAGVLVLRTTNLRREDGEKISPAEGRVKTGDYITEFDGQALHSKEELVEKIARNGTKKVRLTLLRDGKKKKVSVKPMETEDHRFFLGIWVKDDMAGIGTLTYYREDGTFGALGHGIGDGETGGLLSVEDGRIYTMTLTGIQKGRAGEPGALEGMISYGRDYSLGKVHSNSDIGIYGRLSSETIHNFERKDKSYPVAFKQEITTGKAQILSEVSGNLEAYDIRITDLSYGSGDENKGIRFEVTDPRLKELTGGIVQGMSGSPIIQDGRMIGAVTHVLVSSPEKGYGVFIETMLDEK